MVCLGFASATSHFIPKDVSRSFDLYPNSNDSFMSVVPEPLIDSCLSLHSVTNRAQICHEIP